MSTATTHTHETKALTVVEQINRELEAKRKDGCHVLSVYTIQDPPPLHRLTIQVVQLDLQLARVDGSKFPKVVSTDVYPQAGGMVSLRRNAYDKLAAAAGIQWAYHAFGRKDDGRNPRYCHYEAVGLIKEMNGAWRTVVADKAIDMDVMEAELRNNYQAKAESYRTAPDSDIPKDFRHVTSPAAANAWVEEKVRLDALQIQKHIVARAQTGAMSRVVEKALSLRKSYRPDELQKPFVFAALVFTPNPDHPQDRQFMLEQGAGATAALYAPPPTSTAAREAQRTDLPVQGFPMVEADYIDHEPASPAQATAAAPTKDEQLRADFLSAEPAQQVEILTMLMRRKAYVGKVQGDLVKWAVQDRTKFYDRLTAMPDAQATTGHSAPLPFE